MIISFMIIILYNLKTFHTCSHFIDILRMNFLYECHFSSFFYVHVTREKLPKRRSYVKFTRKMLMKLTPDLLGLFQPE